MKTSGKRGLRLVGSRQKSSAAIKKTSNLENKTEAKASSADKDGLVVFAFRLTADERDVIHKAAGPGRASRFVRALAVAAARKDEAIVRQILREVHEDHA